MLSTRWNKLGTRTLALSLGPRGTAQARFPANVSRLQDPQIPTFLIDPLQPLLCQHPTAHDADHRNQLTQMPTSDSSPTTTWKLKKLPVPQCSFSSIFILPWSTSHVLMLFKNCPLCYRWKVGKIEMNYCWPFKCNRVLIKVCSIHYCTWPWREAASPKWNLTKPLIADFNILINDDTL